MVFQYNPLDFHIETESGELLFSICRLDSLSPKLRYNLHDSGYVVRFPELTRALAGFGTTTLAERYLDLPLLFHYGRSAAAVAFYGEGHPADVRRRCSPSRSCRSSLRRSYSSLARTPRPTRRSASHLARRRTAGAEGGRAAPRLLDALVAVNQDYREASRFATAGRADRRVPRSGTGPFAGQDIGLKRTYIRAPRGAGNCRPHGRGSAAQGEHDPRDPG